MDASLVPPHDRSVAALLVDPVEIEGVSAREALARQAARFRELAAASQRIYAALSLDDTLAVTTSEARRLIDADVAVIRLEEPGTVRREHASLASIYASIAEVPAGDLPWIDAPLRGSDGVAFGGVRVGGPRAGAFRPADAFLLAGMAETAAVAVDKARSHAAMQSTMRAREDLLAIVSHDLRNPLNTVSMSAALLRQDLPPRDVPLVDRIHRAMNRMNRLIGDLLDAALLDQGRLQVAPRAEPAAAIVLEASDAASPMASARGSRIEVNVADGDVSVLADRDRLLQVLANLLGNAIKFSPESSTVTAGAVREGAFARFFVADSGPGIEARHVEHLFERYYKVNPASRVGAGLGLFIARGIIEGHNGHIRIESEPGRGTRVSFTIPLAPYSSLPPSA